MKKIIIPAIIVLGLLVTYAFTQKPTHNDPVKMQNKSDTISYGLGVNIAKNLQSQGFKNLNTTIMAKAMEDVMKNGTLEIDEKTSQDLINAYFKELQESKATEAKKSGEDFLAANAKKKGVVTLPSGLQYEILTAGTGPKPAATDRVKVHYHGTTIDGKVFDSSVERGEPISFGLNQVIKGWTEGVQLMPTGSKWRLFIPYDMAYGAQGSPPAIPAYAALIFEVELIGINVE